MGWDLTMLREDTRWYEKEAPLFFFFACEQDGSRRRGTRVTAESVKPLVILGTGYTGRSVYEREQARGLVVFATSRDPDRHLLYVPPERRIRFDLADRTTWRNLPRDSNLLWCFPAEPLELVQEFAATINMTANRLVVLGSTSAYQMIPSRDYPPPWIDETAPLDRSKPRVQGEEWLRTTCQVIVLRVSGIYGPGRHPLKWIKQGRVGPSRKYVNLIHVEDLANICLVALERGVRGEAYNVSDGTPRTWQDICHLAREQFGIQRIVEVGNDSAGKRIANGKLLSLLTEAGTSLVHPDLTRSLEQIVAAEASTEATP
jgi:nucleoside-diphosphate-sugar epimerase